MSKVRKYMASDEIKREKFIRDYFNYSKQHRDGISEGHSQKTNRAYGKLTKLYRELQKNTDFANQVLPILLSSNDEKVSSWSAAHCLGLNLFVEEAEKLLEDISLMQLPMLSFSAKMTLSVWREQGFLRF